MGKEYFAALGGFVGCAPCFQEQMEETPCRMLRVLASREEMFDRCVCMGVLFAYFGCILLAH